MGGRKAIRSQAAGGNIHTADDYGAINNMGSSSSNIGSASILRSSMARSSGAVVPRSKASAHGDTVAARAPFQTSNSTCLGLWRHYNNVRFSRGGPTYTPYKYTCKPSVANSSPACKILCNDIKYTY